jgi:hypothetical protein
MQRSKGSLIISAGADEVYNGGVASDAARAAVLAGKRQQA